MNKWLMDLADKREEMAVIESYGTKNIPNGG